MAKIKFNTAERLSVLFCILALFIAAYTGGPVLLAVTFLFCSPTLLAIVEEHR